MKTYSEKQCYANLYGSLVFSVPHYFKNVKLDGEGHFEVEFANGKTVWNISQDVGYYTLDDLLSRVIFWGKQWGNYKLKGQKL